MDQSDLWGHAQHVDSVLEPDLRMSEAKTKLRLLQESNYSRSSIKQWIAQLGERFRDSE